MSADESPADLPANSPWGGPSRRGFQMRKREDQAADLFRTALQHLEDPGRLRHALLELSRTYDPVTNAALLPAEIRHRILERVGMAKTDEARQLLEGALATYLDSGRPRAPAGGPP